MKYFSDRYGNYYPVSRIHKIVALPRLRSDESKYDVRYQTVYLDDEQKAEVAQYEITEILSAPHTMIPAQPGTFILSSVFPDYESADEVWKSPVVAWAIGVDGEIRPWTCEGENDALTRSGPILHPDGRVDDPHVESHRSLTEWFESEMKKVREAEELASASPLAADQPGS